MTLVVLAWLLPPVRPAQAAVDRVFTSERQCENAHALAPGRCRTAFANALAEFASKAPSFASRRACFKAFGPCMPWPLGTRRFDQFRPQWIGITVAPDRTALPAVAPGRMAVAFTPQSTEMPVPAKDQAPQSAEDANNAPRAAILTPDDEGDRAPAGPAPRAGGGFTMIDGVLTYPAPARFQPKTSRHP